MSSISKSGNGPPGKKKPGRPRNDENGISSLSNLKPPALSLPPAPVLSEIVPVTTSPYKPREISPRPPMIRSPIDQTPIVVNGKVVDLNAELEERVNNASPTIKPITPPSQPRNEIIQEYNEQTLTPPSLPLPDVDILETPQTTPMKIQNEETESVSSEETEESVPKPQDLPVPIVQKVSSLEPIKVETIPTKPLNFTNVLNLSPASTSDETYVTESSEEQFIQNVEVPETPEPVRKESLADPFEVGKTLHLVGSAESEEEESDQESEYEENNDENEEMKPVMNQPFLPAISGRFRADSPIETIGGPSSPPIRGLQGNKPMFSTEGKSFTPKRISSPLLNSTSPKVINKIVEDNNVPSVRHIIQASPKAGEGMKIPSPIKPGASPRAPGSRPISPRNMSPKPAPPPQQIQGPAMFFPPKPRDDGSIFGGRPDYAKLTMEQEIYMRTQFRAKFGILRTSYPEWNIQDPDERMTLDQIHDVYEYYIRQIMVSKETGQYKVYLVIFFMFIEVIGVKLLKLNMSGYTMSQLRIMNRYDTLLAELGEKWLVSSGSDWPVEARLLMMATFNAVIFIAVRYLCSWMGVDGLAETIQNFVDSMLNGPGQGNNNNLTYGGYPGQNPMSASGAPPKPPTPVIGKTESGAGNPLDGIASAFSGLFGGGNNASAGGSNAGGGFAEGIAKLGTMFTKNMQNNNKAAPAVAAKAPGASAKPTGKGRIDKRTLFG
jgi:hypothetical protein